MKPKTRKESFCKYVSGGWRHRCGDPEKSRKVGMGEKTRVGVQYLICFNLCLWQKKSFAFFSSYHLQMYKCWYIIIPDLRYWCKKCNKRFASQMKLVDHMSSPEHNNLKTPRWEIVREIFSSTFHLSFCLKNLIYFLISNISIQVVKLWSNFTRGFESKQPVSNTFPVATALLFSVPTALIFPEATTSSSL